jgi:hypothetical protein
VGPQLSASNPGARIHAGGWKSTILSTRRRLSARSHSTGKSSDMKSVVRSRESQVRMIVVWPPRAAFCFVLCAFCTPPRPSSVTRRGKECDLIPSFAGQLVACNGIDQGGFVSSHRDGIGTAMGIGLRFLGTERVEAEEKQQWLGSEFRGESPTKTYLGC